eukprot:m.27924 g.27924  ORF g.27924 m.27924 type:complete len:231 (-) comp15835_c0_seq1:1711-2403(-)
MAASELTEKLRLAMTPDYQGGNVEFLALLRQCVDQREFAAAVFVWDQLFVRGWKPIDAAYRLLEGLHSKKIQESKAVKVPHVTPQALAPRRRIHKIIKGWRIKQVNVGVFDYVDKAIDVLNTNPNLKTLHRHQLAKALRKLCNIADLETARRLVTKLKQKKILPPKSEQIKQEKKTSEDMHKQRKPGKSTNTSSQFKKKMSQVKKPSAPNTCMQSTSASPHFYIDKTPQL